MRLRRAVPGGIRRSDDYGISILILMCTRLYADLIASIEEERKGHDMENEEHDMDSDEALGLVTTCSMRLTRSTKMSERILLLVRDVIDLAKMAMRKVRLAVRI